MIAFAAPADADVHRQFEMMIPQIQGRLRWRFRRYRPDRRDEYVAEATAWSWQMYLSARRQGRQVTPGNLAWFSAKAVLAGRRLAGSTITDALSESPHAQARVGVHVSLGEAGAGPSTKFNRVFGDRRWRWPIIDVVGPAMDWASFLASRDERDRRIAEMKFEGSLQTEIAAELGISPSAVCLRLRAMHQQWNDQAVA